MCNTVQQCFSWVTRIDALQISQAEPRPHKSHCYNDSDIAYRLSEGARTPGLQSSQRLYRLSFTLTSWRLHKGTGPSAIQMHSVVVNLPPKFVAGDSSMQVGWQLWRDIGGGPCKNIHRKSSDLEDFFQVSKELEGRFRAQDWAYWVHW